MHRAVRHSAVSTAQSNGAHFQKGQESLTCSSTNPTDLVVSFTEAGLGNSDVTYDASCTAATTWQCFNNGGNHPKAGNKETTVSEANGGNSFTPQNGSVTGDVTISAPTSPGNFSCPGGQTLVMTGVTYSNCSLTDVTNNVTYSFRGTTQTCP